MHNLMTLEDHFDRLDLLNVATMLSQEIWHHTGDGTEHASDARPWILRLQDTARDKLNFEFLSGQFPKLLPKTKLINP